MRRKLLRIASSDLTITAIDQSGDRRSMQGRLYELATTDGGLTLTIAEWRVAVATIERDMVRDAVPLPARRRTMSVTAAKRSRKRRH